MKKFINRTKWHLKEVSKTFSNQPSFYSSKRIERAIIFVNATIMLDILVWHLLKEGKLDEMGVVGIYAAQMAYAGFQTNKLMQEKKNEANKDSD